MPTNVHVDQVSNEQQRGLHSGKKHNFLYNENVFHALISLDDGIP